MGIKYELSLWCDYPSSSGVREEKIEIIAATGMDFAGRAQNIKLKREYTGKLTLEFELPVKYFDPLSGQTIKNPLCQKVIEKSKLKLWRDEYWWNPFGGNETYDEKTKCTKYEGKWTHGRWYDLVVNSHKEKRSKKQLFYTYTCDSLFMDELARNGYNLQFVPNTDIMSANGMGTAHDLAERIVEGTNWKYIKTEIFPDYKEEFNAATGETVKIPVATDQIEFSKGLDRYCYCYEINDITDEIKNDILTSLKQQSVDLGLSDIENSLYGFEDNKFWWRSRPDDEKKSYIWGHLKTDISINAATNLCSMDSGGMKYYINNEDTKVTGATTFTNGLNVWQQINGTTSLSGYSSNEDDLDGDFVSFMQLTPVDGKSTILFRGAETTALSQGEVYCIQFSSKEKVSPTIKIWDGRSGNYQEALNNKFEESEKIKPIVTLDFMDNTSTNAFDNTMWFIVPTHIAQPHFTVHINSSSVINVQSIYIYQFKGYNKEVENLLNAARSKANSAIGYIHHLSLSKEGVTFNLQKNLMIKDGEITPIWLGFGKITAEGYQQETYAYPLEFYANGKYYNIYLPLNNKDIVIKKISNYNVDKRRQISGEKSNRFSLIETVAKTFQCFTRFLVDHDDQGRIKLDKYGQPIKRFTFVNELGRKNFNGFNYGVNLENVERSVDANNLVTKCHVESISNQYSESNLISIQESKYNKLGMTFIYNFSYYLQMGLLDKAKFLKDYQSMLDYVNIRTQQNLTSIKNNASQVSEQAFLQTRIDTTQIILNSYITQAQEELELIAWNRFLDGTIINGVNYIGHRQVDTNGEYLNGYKAEDYQFPTIKWKALKNYTTSTNKKWFSYQDGKVITKWNTESDYQKNGYRPMTTGFSNRHELALYMAYNALGSAGVFTRPSKVPSGESFYWARGLGDDDVENVLIKIETLQKSYQEQKAAMETDQARLSILDDHLKKYREELDKNNKEIDQKINWFEKRYQQFLTEGQWSGNDYIDADSYYLDATRAQSEACMPKVSYSIGAMDLSRISNPFNPEDSEWGKDFIYDVGDTSYIKDEELFGQKEQYTMIASITSYVDLNKQDDIELRNFETRFEELFQSIAATVTSFQLNENIWGRAANFNVDGTIDESILQTSFDNNKNLVISSSNNSVIQDNRGITVKDQETGKVTRLIGGGIFLSTDGGYTFKTGLTPDGINASLITAGQIDTSKIVIRNNDTPLFELNSQGLTANRIVDNSFTRFDQFGIYSTDMAGRFTKNWWTEQDDNSAAEYIANNSIFSLTRLGLDMKYTKGGLTFGTIGYIDGIPNKWGLKVTKENTTTVEIDHEGNAFFAGELRAATGSFEGTITATAGKIGGWTLRHLDLNDDNKFVLYSRTTDSGVGMSSASYNDDPMFYSGYTGYGDTPWDHKNLRPENDTTEWINHTSFYVTRNGKIHSTAGSIGGWEITNTKLVKNLDTAYACGIQASPTQDSATFFAGWNHKTYSGNIVGPSSDPFKYTNFYVKANGDMYCKNATIKGTLQAGSIIFPKTAAGTSQLGDLYMYTNGSGVTCLLDKSNDSGARVRLHFADNANYDNTNSGFALYSTSGTIRTGIIFTGAGNLMTLHGTVKLSNGNTVTSDINKKHEILDLSIKYSNLFDNLRPVTYKYNDGTSNRLHTGFIAQEVQEALDKSNIDSQDFAGLVIFDRGTEKEEWTLRYEEFVALNTSEIQKLKSRVAELERKLESLT